MTPVEALRYYGWDNEKSRAVERLSATLGCSRSSVWDWLKKEHIPFGRQYQIQLATKGRLRASQPAERERV